jgi:hypothetical protein
MKFNEQQIKERRTVEAIQKEYMGFQGKFVNIAKNLGSEIIDQGYMSESFISYDDFWKKDKDDIQKMDMDQNIELIGWHYESLRIGINLEIFIFDNDKKIKVIYNGNNVYEETSGDLDMYVPYNEWEEAIEKIFKISKIIEKDKKQVSKENLKIEFERRKKNLLAELNYKWGV